MKPTQHCSQSIFNLKNVLFIKRLRHSEFLDISKSNEENMYNYSRVFTTMRLLKILRKQKIRKSQRHNVK